MKKWQVSNFGTHHEAILLKIKLKLYIKNASLWFPSIRAFFSSYVIMKRFYDNAYVQLHNNAQEGQDPWQSEGRTVYCHSPVEKKMQRWIRHKIRDATWSNKRCDTEKREKTELEFLLTMFGMLIRWRLFVSQKGNKNGYNFFLMT